MITRAELLLVPMTLVQSFETSSHRKSGLNHILVHLWDDQENEGWGECAAPTDPYYCPETSKTAWHILQEYLLPAVAGQEIEQYQTSVASTHAHTASAPSHEPSTIASRDIRKASLIKLDSHIAESAGIIRQCVSAFESGFALPPTF